MKKRLAALWVLLAANGWGCSQAETPLAPFIRSFTADKAQANPGEAVTLSWEVERATDLVLTDQTGATLGTFDAQSDRFAVTPDRTHFYVLHAKGDGGRDTAFVQVAVAEALSDAVLIPIPAEVAGGQEVELLWSASGATQVLLRSADGTATPLTGTSGSVKVRPERSATYALSASGGGKNAMAEAAIRVLPWVLSFQAVPPAAHPGESLSLYWTTAGATEVSLSENTFGELGTIRDLARVDRGALSWTVPATLPNGLPTPTGLPVLFRLKAKSSSPEAVQTRTLSGYVGDGPSILSFDVPNAATAGKSTVLIWRTANAYRVTLKANGLLLADSLPGVTSGSAVLPPIERDTTVELTVTSYNGLVVSSVKTIRRVAAPQVSAFMINAAIDTAGDPATATWTTQQATRVVLRVHGGPAIFTSDAAAEVAKGSLPIYPLTNTHFVLEAFNAAGDVATAEKTVEVATPGDLSVTPTLAIGTTTAKLKWNLSGFELASVAGVPSEDRPTLNPMTQRAPVESLDPKILAFENRSDAVAVVHAPAGFSFPFFGERISTFYVSTNGFVGLLPVSPLPENVALAPGNPAPTVLAPFWDDLDLGEGQVRVALEGTRFPRRLTIEWDRVRLAADAESSLTFQLQLLETGEFRFVYSALKGKTPDSLGAGATVGAQHPGLDFRSQHSVNNPRLAEGRQLTYFNRQESPGSGTLTLSTPNARVYTLFFRTLAGKTLVAALPLRVFQPNSVRIDEVMPRPHPDVLSTGAWVELSNATDTDLDLSGLELRTNGSATGFKFPANASLPAKATVVYGQSLAPDETGGAPVDRLFSDLPFADQDTISLGFDGLVLSSLSWTGTTAGGSIQPPQALVDATSFFSCERKQTFGEGSVGTPGRPNETCFEYRLDSIASRYVDISTEGTPLFTPSTGDEGSATWRLAVPFPYFGEPRASVVVGVNGWLAFKPTTGGNSENRTVCDKGSEPVGGIAVFWDDLKLGAVAGSNVYVRRFGAFEDGENAVGNTVVQWHGVTSFYASDDLNFQAKLFDDGVIELHYGPLQSRGTTTEYADGQEATVWIERPNGSAALFVGRNEPVLQPFTSYRFTPRR
ncbi:MAG: lamin tail domain-containing protein [Myxococcaceae bacterium]